MKRQIFSLLIASMIASLFIIPVYAQDAHQVVKHTLKEQNYKTTTVRGISASTEYWFPGNGPVTTLEGTRFVLHYMHSPAIISTHSSMTVVLNEQEIFSTDLLEGDGDEHWLEIELPEGLVSPLFNNIRINFYMRHTIDDDEICTDPYSPALWATVFEDSYIEYSLGDIKPYTETLDLSLFPQPFIMDSLGPEITLNIQLPDSIDNTTLTDAISVMAKLGQLSGTQAIMPTTQNANQRPDEPTISIGTGNAFPWLASVPDLPLAFDPVSGLFLDTSGNQIDPEIGVIQLIPASGEAGVANPVLLISGGNSEGVTRAAKVISSGSFSSLLRGNYALVNSTPSDQASSIDLLTTGTFSFGDLTQSTADFTVRGRGTQYINIPFSMPQSWDFGDKVPSLNIHYSHADGLDKRSLLTIEINGTAIGSVRLNDQNTTGANFTVVIPESVINSDNNTIAMVFDIYPYDDDPCDFEFQNSAWGTIHRDSILTMDYDEGTNEPSLSSYAAPFVQGGQINDTTIIVPAAPDRTSLDLLFNFAETLGKRTTADMITLPVIMTDDSNNVPKSNIIMVGSPDKLQLLKETEGWLPLQFDSEGNLVWLENEESLLKLKSDKPLGIIEISYSPWQKEKLLLLISGTDKNAINWSINALTTSLTGNVAIASSEESIDTLTLKTAPKAQPIAVEEKLPIWITVAIIAIVVVLLAITVYVSVQRSRSESGESE